MFARTRKQWREEIQTVRPRKPVKRKPKPPCAAYSPEDEMWILEIPGQEFVWYALADTASEARANIKEELGLPRLPVGTVVVPYKGSEWEAMKKAATVGTPEA